MVFTAAAGMQPRTGIERNDLREANNGFASSS
jgi:hypothetical protein